MCLTRDVTIDKRYEHITDKYIRGIRRGIVPIVPYDVLKIGVCYNIFVHNACNDINGNTISQS